MLTKSDTCLSRVVYSLEVWDRTSAGHCSVQQEQQEENQILIRFRPNIRMIILQQLCELGTYKNHGHALSVSALLVAAHTVETARDENLPKSYEVIRC
jgi:hypothetical protein